HVVAPPFDPRSLLGAEWSAAELLVPLFLRLVAVTVERVLRVVHGVAGLVLELSPALLCLALELLRLAFDAIAVHVLSFSHGRFLAWSLQWSYPCDAVSTPRRTGRATVRASSRSSASSARRCRRSSPARSTAEGWNVTTTGIVSSGTSRTRPRSAVTRAARSTSACAAIRPRQTSTLGRTSASS